MSVTMVRQQVKEARVDEARAAVRDLFGALDRVRPDGIRYASTRVEGTSTFVILVELAEGLDDPRRGLPEFGRFQEQLKDLVEGPPTIEQLEVVGTYHLFGARRTEPAAR